MVLSCPLIMSCFFTKLNIVVLTDFSEWLNVARILLRSIYLSSFARARAGDTWRGAGAIHTTSLPPPPPTHTHTHSLFCVAKRKKGNKGKQERLSKQKPLKGCH